MNTYTHLICILNFKKYIRKFKFISLDRIQIVVVLLHFSESAKNRNKKLNQSLRIWRIWSLLLFRCIKTFSTKLNIDEIYNTGKNWLQYHPLKWVWPRWAKNLNCKYKYSTNWTQLSRKQLGWQVLWAPYMGFKKRKFFDFRHIMSLRGKVVLHIQKLFSPFNSLRS